MISGAVLSKEDKCSSWQLWKCSSWCIIGLGLRRARMRYEPLGADTPWSPNICSSKTSTPTTTPTLPFFVTLCLALLVDVSNPQTRNSALTTVCSDYKVWFQFTLFVVSCFLIFMTKENSPQPNWNQCKEMSSAHWVFYSCKLSDWKEARRGLKKGLPEGCGILFYENWQERRGGGGL